MRPHSLRSCPSQEAPFWESGAGEVWEEQEGSQEDGSRGGSRRAGPFPALFSGCLLTIILLMRALDPLLYEKETLQYFQTLKASSGFGNRRGGGPGGRRKSAATNSLLAHSLPGCGPNAGSIPG